MKPSSIQVTANAVEVRLKELRDELDKGKNHLDLLEKRSREVRDTLLRISGAIQVLEELLSRSPFPNGEKAAHESADRLALTEPASRVAL